MEFSPLWGVYTIQQTSSKLAANVFKIHVWTFAGSCKHPITMHGESRRQSPRQSLGQVCDKVADWLRTQIMKVGDVICVADFHDLCLLSQSRRNGIWDLRGSTHALTVAARLLL